MCIYSIYYVCVCVYIYMYQASTEKSTDLEPGTMFQESF